MSFPSPPTGSALTPAADRMLIGIRRVVGVPLRTVRLGSWRGIAVAQWWVAINEPPPDIPDLGHCGALPLAIVAGELTRVTPGSESAMYSWIGRAGRITASPPTR